MSHVVVPLLVSGPWLAADAGASVLTKGVVIVTVLALGLLGYAGLGRKRRK